MSLTRSPADALTLDLDALLVRWRQELAELDRALEIPALDPGSPPSSEWQAAMRERTDLLHPLAAELATVYLRRLDANQRRELIELVGAHRLVVWQWSAVISDYFDRFLQSLAQYDFDVACALIAIHDERAQSRDFSRLAYPFFVRIEQRGIDARALFRAALPLAVVHDDPQRGARGFFLQYGIASE